MHEGAGCAPGAQEIHQQIEHLRVQDGWSLEMFACSRGPGKDKNSRSNDGADAERRQRPRAQSFAQLMLRLFGFSNQLVNGFAAEKLVGLRRSGSSVRSGGLSQGCVRLLLRRVREDTIVGRALAFSGYLFACPRTSFFTLLFFDPRAYSRGFSGFSVLRFLRAVRFDFLRSSLLRADVFAMSS